jgi:FKBP-type peptidyl-prolyl cis-trans isomerase 2
MSKKLIQNGSNIEVIFSIKTEDGRLVFGEEEGKSIKFLLDSDKPLFEIFKCLIGKEEGYSGKFKVNKVNFTEELEELSIESLPSYLSFEKDTIIQIGSGHKKFGFIKDIKENLLIIEVSKPFKNITSILNVKIMKVD